MGEKGICSVDYQNSYNHGRMKPDKWKNAPEDTPDNRLQCGDSGGNGIVKFLAVMMNDVRCPQKIYFVPEPMIPIPYQIRSQYQNDPHKPMIRNGEYRKMNIYKREDTVKACGQKKVQQPFGYTDTQVCHRALEFKQVPLISPARRKIFQA